MKIEIAKSLVGKRSVSLGSDECFEATSIFGTASCPPQFLLNARAVQLTMASIRLVSNMVRSSPAFSRSSEAIEAGNRRHFSTASTSRLTTSKVNYSLVRCANTLSGDHYTLITLSLTNQGIN